MSRAVKIMMRPLSMVLHDSSGIKRSRGSLPLCVLQQQAAMATHTKPTIPPSGSSVGSVNGAAGESSSEAAAMDARMEEARRRFGLAPGAKDPVPVTPASRSTQEEGEEDTDWNEVWGDYIDYMSHQR